MKEMSMQDFIDMKNKLLLEHSLEDTIEILESVKSDLDKKIKLLEDHGVSEKGMTKLKADRMQLFCIIMALKQELRMGKQIKFKQNGSQVTFSA